MPNTDPTLYGACEDLPSRNPSILLPSAKGIRELDLKLEREAPHMQASAFGFSGGLSHSWI